MADGGDEYTQADDILRLLVQRVGRAFYEKEHVVVLDMLLNYRGYLWLSVMAVCEHHV